jgi:hypothetical protein
MATDNFCFYFQNRLIQTSQTEGQWYNDTSPFSIPCPSLFFAPSVKEKKSLITFGAAMRGSLPSTAKHAPCLSGLMTVSLKNLTREVLLKGKAQHN